MARIEKGNIQLGVHASSVWYDNISIREISVIKSANIKTEAEIMLAGESYDIWAESENGEKIPFDMLDWEYDHDKAVIDNGRITPNTSGELAVSANYTGGSAEKAIRVQKEYDFEDYELIVSQQNVFCGSRIDVAVKGICEGNEYYVRKNLNCTSDAGAYDGTSITTSVPGKHEIKVVYNGITKAIPIYVSVYESASIRLEKTNIPVNSSTAFSVWVSEGGRERRLAQEEYRLTAEDGLSVTGEEVFAARTGGRRLFAEIDSVAIDTILNVLQIEEGIVTEEDFEDAAFSEFFTMEEDKIITEADGNRAYMLYDEFSPFFGDTSWHNYKVSGRVKILNK